jgi:hypothetical protein
MARASAAFALSLSTAAPLSAADWPVNVEIAPVAVSNWSFSAATSPASYVGEFGTRLWFARARTAKDLFDDTGAQRVSRLTYYDLSVFSGEAFSRLVVKNGWVLMGYAGGGGLLGGHLKDVDFPPAINPYSATLSAQRDGSLWYGSVDGGIKFLRGPDFHLGAFVGYHFLRDYVAANGCGQIAANPDVCAGGIPDSLKVISQVNNWHALRVGLEASVEFDRRWRLTIDAAWLPYARLYGADSHLLRIGSNPGDFTGPVPEDGKGWGYQIDAVVSYNVNNWLHVGAGGRYWHVESKGYTHFEGHVVGFNALPQVVRWNADHFGGFLQASVKFGPYPLISTN